MSASAGRCSRGSSAGCSTCRAISATAYGRGSPRGCASGGCWRGIPHADIASPSLSTWAPDSGCTSPSPPPSRRAGGRVPAQLQGRARRGAAVAIGADTRFTYGPVIQCGERIEIGERCMFGQAPSVVDGNHRFRDLDRPMLEQGYDLRPVVIEDDAVLTTKCTVVGARHRPSPYVGAGAVVVADIRRPTRRRRRSGPRRRVASVPRRRPTHRGASGPRLTGALRRRRVLAQVGRSPAGPSPRSASAQASRNSGREQLLEVEVGAVPDVGPEPRHLRRPRAGRAAGRGRLPAAAR